MDLPLSAAKLCPVLLYLSVNNTHHISSVLEIRSLLSAFLQLPEYPLKPHKAKYYIVQKLEKTVSSTSGKQENEWRYLLSATDAG